MGFSKERQTISPIQLKSMKWSALGKTFRRRGQAEKYIFASGFAVGVPLNIYQAVLLAYNAWGIDVNRKMVLVAAAEIQEMDRPLPRAHISNRSTQRQFCRMQRQPGYIP